MKIIIAGSGDTGTHLAKMLSCEKQDVVLISDDREFLDGLDATYNLMTFAGSATSVKDLREAGVAKSDLFVGVTASGSDNMVACQLASALGCGRTVARVESEELTEPVIARAFSSAGIDTLIYPEILVAEEIRKFVERNWVVKWHELHGGRLIFAGVRIRECSEVAGRMLSDIQSGERTFHVLAIKRRGGLIIPRGSDTLEAGDVAYFTILPANADLLSEQTGQCASRIRNIMIAGGGKIGSLLLKEFSGKYNVTLLEPDAELCRRLAGDYPEATIVNAAASDLSAMKSEEIGKMDLFIALEGNAASNIVSCMMAKEMGACKAVAEIEDTQYIPEAERLQIDKVVNKKLITSATILRSILGKGVRVNSLFSLEEAEVAEIVAGEGSGIVASPVKDLRLPKEMTLGGLIRGERGMLIDGNTLIRPGDKVLVIFLPGTLMKVQKIFRK